MKVIHHKDRPLLEFPEEPASLSTNGGESIRGRRQIIYLVA
jgi:hypothetical protein